MEGIAFIVGVSDYNDPKLAQLNGPDKDANDLETALRYLKYDVISINDPKDIVDEKWNKFKEEIKQNEYNTSIVFFSGHGMHINNSECLLLCDAIAPTTDSDSRAKGKSLILKDLMEELEDLELPVKIFIIDACRTLPKHKGIVGGGIKLEEITKQTFIAYATAIGEPARDGNKGENSVFTEALLKYIYEEKLAIEHLFKKVRLHLASKSIDQTPWEHTCLIAEFSFNHGQLSKYYDKPYNTEVFIRSQYIPSDIEDSIIQGLMSTSAAEQKNAISLLAKVNNNLSDEQMFIIGRYLYASAASGSNPSRKFISSASNMGRFYSSNKNHLLRGLYYEIFFDQDDNMRENPLGDSGLLTDIENLRTIINDIDAETFVTNELTDDYIKNGYSLGKTHEKKFKIKLLDSDLYDERWKNIKLINDIILDNNSIISEVRGYFENKIIDLISLRHFLANKYALPLQKIKVSYNIAKNDGWSTVALIDEIPDIGTLLSDYFSDDIPDEINILSSLSYVEEVDDITISYVSQYDNEMTVRGEMTVSAHLEYDGEDAGNMSFPGTFSLKLIKNENSGDWELSSKENVVKINTDSFYQ